MGDSTPQDHDVVELRRERAQIERVSDAILSAAEARSFSKASRFAVRLALEEAITNAFAHGHAGLDASLTVTVEYRVGAEEIWIAVEDQGPGFVPSDVPDPTADENLALPSGRGLMLMRTYMTEVEYVGRGNRVEMVYRRPRG